MGLVSCSTTRLTGVFEMRVFSIVLLTVIVVSVSVMAGFLIGVNQKKQKMLACTVERIIDDPGDEPAAIGESKPPRTILLHSPQWKTLNLPGVLGEPGKIVYVEDPETN